MFENMKGTYSRYCTQQAFNPWWWCTLRPVLVAIDSPVLSELGGKASLSGLQIAEPSQGVTGTLSDAGSLTTDSHQTMRVHILRVQVPISLVSSQAYPSVAPSWGLLWEACFSGVLNFKNFCFYIILNLEKKSTKYFLSPLPKLSYL